MKRIAAVVLALGFLAPVVPAKDSLNLIRLEGWVVDAWCGAKNAHAEAKEDTLACQKKGARLILVTDDGTTYDLDDQERALKHAGERVKVFGTLHGTRQIKVGNYVGEKKESKKGPGIKPAQRPN